MAWPSGTKASTVNVDAGADKPSLARPDIKQNIDNVNSIIDTFDIAAPNDGDTLQYNSTLSVWQPVASSGGGGGGAPSIVWGAIPTTFTNGDQIAQLTSTFNNNNIANVSTASDSWTFTETGTYYFRINEVLECSAANVFWKIKNNTQTTYTTWRQITNTVDVSNLKYGWVSLSVTSISDTYSLVITATSSGSLSTPSNGWGAEFIKA